MMLKSSIIHTRLKFEFWLKGKTRSNIENTCNSIETDVCSRPCRKPIRPIRIINDRFLFRVYTHCIRVLHRKCAFFAYNEKNQKKKKWKRNKITEQDRFVFDQLILCMRSLRAIDRARTIYIRFAAHALRER